MGRVDFPYDTAPGHVRPPDEPEDGPTALPIVELLARIEEEVFGPRGSFPVDGRRPKEGMRITVEPLPTVAPETPDR